MGKYRNIPFAGENSKPGLGAQNPNNALDEAWQRNEPLITPEQLKDRFLFGLALHSLDPDPVTGLVRQVTDDELNELIQEAVILAEEELDIHIFPVQVNERKPWDRASYGGQSFGYLKLLNRPVASIERVTIQSQDGSILYEIPQDWIETGLMGLSGQINIIPLTTVSLTGVPQASATSNGQAAYLNLLANQWWVPGFWNVIYTTGFMNGQLPKQINQYIGCIAAIEILSMLSATNARNSSTSLGIDSLSQSRGNPGPQLYMQRIQDLQQKKDMLLGRIRAKTGRKFFSGTL